ncbi:MAG: hypothetical protein HUJ26_01520 [Planctomycetaceae bacterium]|nr:hypothetical protein [Planctomycetaceae bacterium]
MTITEVLKKRHLGLLRKPLYDATMKERDNHREYLQALRRMTPAQRVRKALELGERNKRLLKQALRKRFPEMSDDDLHQLYLERLAQCHNRNY